MVKSNQPLQIRLTEPVVFLRGPTTGLDHRGRPTGIDTNAAPAMLRGLLTLRLSKATRIRSITVKLDGKSRTEWPEGIGPRRLDTFEEHTIIEESTTFFDARRRSSRSQSARRATSVGPGVYAPPSDLSSEEIDDDLDLVDVPGESGEDWTAINRGRDRGRGGPPRSASALPGIHDNHTWHRDGFSRRNSMEHSDPERSRRGSNEFMTIRDLRNGEGERGPSPAYTPMASTTQLSTTLNPNSSSRGDFRESILSPIQSAVTSRAASDRDDSTDTQQRYPMERRQSSLPSEEVRERGEETESPGIMEEEDQHHAIRSILSQGPLARNRPSTGGEVRFAQPEGADEAEGGENLGAVTEADGTGPSTAAYHPHAAAIHAISAVSTAHNSPAPSRPGSLYQPRNSLDTPPPAVSDGPHAQNSPRNSISRLPMTDPGPTASAASSRPSSIFRSPAESSTASLTETRQGKKNRLGSHSTIVINNDPTVPPVVPDDLPVASGSGTIPPVSGPSVSPDRPRPSSLAPQPKQEDNDRRRGRFSLAATLRGLSQDVKDRVRQSSKSRTRQPSIPRHANGSHTDIPVPPLPPSHRSSLSAHDDFNPSRPRSTSRHVSSSSTQFPADSINGNGGPRTATLRRGSYTFAQDPDFVPPGGSRGGAGRVNQSRERRRTESPAPDQEGLTKRGGRSPSRSRGRNKGMKVLTDALGLGDGRPEGEEEGEDVHNWKEFRKGTYNYPISFPIPVSTPPTVHAEFGSVSYRLKATVVRVGALSPNLIEEVEVMMIATPQEDDLEESENVIVERQWEEQMRYQIALSGKAFPIGGIIPLSVRIMPLMKCKIHRLSCVLEEKTDYFAQGRKVVRHETPRRFTLLFVKQTDQRPPLPPLLPIISDDPLAARSSPLARLALAAALNNPSAYTNFAGEHDEDALFAGLMDPMGPWHLEEELQIPDCAARVRFTTKHEKTNIAVGHWLKVTIRVERGDDEALDSKGKRKQFDIIIETPIKILDCRVNPQWNSLPTYSTSSPSSTAALGGLCSIHGTRSTAASLQSALTAPRTTSGTSTSRIDGLTPHPPQPSVIRRREEGDDTLLERNIVFDRLMSGQETEAGDVPPTYGEVLAEGTGEGRRASASPGIGRVRGERGQSQSRSRSRLRQEV